MEEYIQMCTFRKPQLQVPPDTKPRSVTAQTGARKYITNLKLLKHQLTVDYFTTKKHFYAVDSGIEPRRIDLCFEPGSSLS